jgi:predicted Ser/Thr protein kinase
VGAGLGKFESAIAYILPEFDPHPAQASQFPPTFSAALQADMTIDPDLIRNLDISAGQLLGHSNQAEVRRFQVEGLDLAIKMPKGRGLAWVARRASLEREYSTYQRLAGLAGFPRCLGFVDRTWLVLEFVDATPFRRARLIDRETFFQRLRASIQAMHAHGVAHGDLKRKDNLLVIEPDQPLILDLGTAVCNRPGFHPVNNRLFRYICQTDLNAWVKLKYAGYENVTPSDKVYLKRSGLERLLGRLRRR